MKNIEKVVEIIHLIKENKIEEGTVFSVSVKKPDSDKEIKTNLRVTKSDLELVETLKSMAGKK